jgi:hypothetical protein
VRSWFNAHQIIFMKACFSRAIITRDVLLKDRLRNVMIRVSIRTLLRHAYAPKMLSMCL